LKCGKKHILFVQKFVQKIAHVGYPLEKNSE